jgi:sulfonate transport system permease protein
MTSLQEHARTASKPAVELEQPQAQVPVDAAAKVASSDGLVKLPTQSAVTAGKRRWRFPRGLERLIGVVLFFAAWQIASDAGWLSEDVLAAPSTVLTVGWDMIRDGSLGGALWTSLQRVLWGLGIGVVIGAALALFAGLSRIGDDLVDSNVQMLRFVPIIGLQSLLILWLGLGETAKISLIVLGVTFPIYINMTSAIRSIDPGYRELATVVGLSRAGEIRRVVLPAVLPGFIVGLRMAVAVSWLLLVFAEQLNAHSGLGYLMVRAQTFFQTDVIVVVLITYAVLGLICDALIRLLERRVLRWQPGR